MKATRLAILCLLAGSISTLISSSAQDFTAHPSTQNPAIRVSTLSPNGSRNCLTGAAGVLTISVALSISLPRTRRGRQRRS